MRAKPGDRPTPPPNGGVLSLVKYARVMRRSRIRIPTPPFGKPRWECTKRELTKAEAWHLKGPWRSVGAWLRARRLVSITSSVLTR